MARRYNTAAIQSEATPAALVNVTPTWISLWDSETGGKLIRTMPITTALSALTLGERLEFPAGALALVKSPEQGGQIAGVRITNGGSGYTSVPTVAFAGSGGAAGTAVIQDGVVIRIDITDPGLGYQTAPAVTFSGGSGTGAAGTALLSGRESEQLCVLHLAGETASDLWIQYHSGAPGPNGTNNVMALARTKIESTNWTAGT